jgi:short-subunit dehydrogenase
MSRTLKDMVVVITGASAGIGKALAEALSARGARLVLAARREDRLHALNAALGGAHLVVPADVAGAADCRRLIEASIERFGRIDTLVCNAGYGVYRRVGQTTPEETRRIFATNVLGTTDCIYYALPLLSRQEIRDGYRAQVMIVSSVVARRGIPFIGMYSATKAAQLALGDALRVELRPRRIAVTTVHPIQTSTEFGKVAEQMGEIKMPGAPIRQTVEHVARRMLAAIQRPAPEVWPSRPSRWAFGMGALAPRLADLALGRYRKKVEAANPGVMDC